MDLGQEILDVDILELFPADEGSINQYYGRIGSGKTYAATADAIADLERGQVVYTNWRLKWDGYDQRKNLWFRFLGLLGLKKTFFVFPKSNWHYFPIEENFTEQLSRLTDCVIYLDEGHVAFDSYEMARMKMDKRAAVLHTRHYNRTINIISQRATAIHVTLRANVNRFFRLENLFPLTRYFGFRIFRKTEFQDLTSSGETVDEDLPVASDWYFSSKRIFNAYDTKYLRGDTPVSQKNFSQVFFVSWKEMWKQFWSHSNKKVETGAQPERRQWFSFLKKK